MPQLGWHRQLWTWNNNGDEIYLQYKHFKIPAVWRDRESGLRALNTSTQRRWKQVTAKRVQSTSASMHQVWTYAHCRTIPPEQAGNLLNETCACFYSVKKKLGVRSGLHKSLNHRPPATKDHNRTCWIIKLLAGNFLCLVGFLVIL